MKKLKLFSKTYIFTMALISLILMISYSLIYLGLPKVYVSNKQKEADKIIENFIEKIDKQTNEKAFEIANALASKYNVQISLKINDEKRTFEGFGKVEVYLNEEVVKNDSVIINDINSEDFIREYETSNYGRNDNQLNKYISVSNSSIVRNEEFKTKSELEGNIQVVMNLESFTETRGVILKLLPYSIGVSVLISLIASYIYSKKITKPIKEICNVTKEMEKLNKSAFCNIDRDDEIGVLASNVNSLYENLLSTIVSLEEEIENVSKSEKVKVDFLRSASHELKTPLMSMHIMIENMLYDIGKYKNHYVYLEKCKEIVNELSKMVQEILDTSKLSAIDDKNEKAIDIYYLLEKIVDRYILIAKSKKINVKIDVIQSFDIKVDEKLFSKVISNIISNAVNYTDEGKEIRIYIKDRKLIIENDCEPISEEHLKHIFEAFYRIDFDRNKSSGGNGLGLYIVKQILEMHKLDYSFTSIARGMKFEIIF